MNEMREDCALPNPPEILRTGQVLFRRRLDRLSMRGLIVGKIGSGCL